MMLGDGEPNYVPIERVVPSHGRFGKQASRTTRRVFNAGGDAGAGQICVTVPAVGLGANA
jgi:hypothetical protein